MCGAFIWGYLTSVRRIGLLDCHAQLSLQVMMMRWIAIAFSLLTIAACNDSAPSATPVSNAADKTTVMSGKCDALRDYEAPSQRFDERAQDLAHATGCFIETDLSETASVQVPAVKGNLSIREAIAKSLEGTSLTITRNEPDLIAVDVNK